MPCSIGCLRPVALLYSSELIFVSHNPFFLIFPLERPNDWSPYRTRRGGGRGRGGRHSTQSGQHGQRQGGGRTHPHRNVGAGGDLEDTSAARAGAAATRAGALAPRCWTRWEQGGSTEQHLHFTSANTVNIFRLSVDCQYRTQFEEQCSVAGRS